MAKYSYICNSCSGKDSKDWLVFEAEHGMNEKPKVKCPKCGGVNTEVCFAGYEPPPFYVRGYGWLDKKGRQADMNHWKLTHEDPYAGMRQKGEKEELAHKLRQSGKFQKNPKSFAVNGTKKK